MEELYEILTGLNIPIAYHHFNQTTAPPFITYWRTGTKHFIADDKVYEKINTFRVELYTEQKDIQKEIALEVLLDTAHLIYEVVAESYIESEKIYQVIYEIEI